MRWRTSTTDGQFLWQNSRVKPSTEILAAHYQETFNTTARAWHQRNLTFLILMLTVAGATLLTFEVTQAQPLLADLIAKAFSIESIERRPKPVFRPAS